ncbi:hypothetical protein ACRB68_31910 [Actinomadura sp. RB68]|uniref:Peptidase M15C domain-containing protein n=2 Tax=Actinomadura macrotermitis TaxID=2585200 RepID=A0A7K0BWR2_9ACTN|nr:hypothetical protein [Actinomadura macrotermitis]
MLVSRSLGVAAIGVALSLAAGCGQGGDDGGAKRTATPPTVASSTATPVPTAPPRFQAQVKPVTAQLLKHSWRKGCPVPLADLRVIEMPYWGMDGKAHTGGRLVVNAEATGPLTKVFGKLYALRYPIRRMEPVDAYKGSDYDSIEADNTSAFNCRAVTGGTGWSRHSYGLAVDVNPCENPYVDSDGHIDHKDCVKFGDRKRRDPGVIHAGDKVVKAFAGIGWGWGGDWNGIKDYQHFSSSGR